jgi:hypothetical protein
MVLNDRVLVANQTDQTQNGVYTVTTVGDGSTAWVLTRSTDTDSAGPSDPNAFGKGDAFFIKEGTTNAGHLDVLTTSGTIVFGTTNIVFAEVAETAVYDAGSGVVLTGTTFSIGQPVATTDDVTFQCVCGTACVKAGNVCGTNCVTSGTCIHSPIICGATCVKGGITCGTTCVKGPTVCGTSYVLSPKIMATCCVTAPIVCSTICLLSQKVCGSVCMESPEFNTTSDCRCKDNIVTVDNAYCKLGHIRGVNYNWKDSGKYTLGVVAQEVEEVLPELISTDGEGYKSVNYNGLIGVLIESVKCLQEKVEELENGSKG